jgi:uncharacterized membrane protein YjgN (DUF898 family)
MSELREHESAIEFTGDWREFAPIAFTNLLLTIVTLGGYLFWARTRERRYLWSRTRFIDDTLEWTGTGVELALGYLMAILIFGVPFAVISLTYQGLLLRGHPGAAATLTLVLYLIATYLIGVAIFRALRYRLSRTLWHGIRGGSDEPGFRFGWSYFWKRIVGFFTLGLLVPWTMTSLWNQRWSRMSFGPYRFDADADYQPVFMRYLLFYLAPVFLFIGGFVLAMVIAAGMAAAGPAALQPGTMPPPALLFTIGLFAVIFYLGFFVVLGVIAIAFYAVFYREAIGKLRLGGLQFDFDARTMDWLRYTAGTVGIVIGTLGVGYVFVGYRNWKFVTRHLHAYGEVQLGDLTQSATRAPSQGEGLLDAFDVGAF